MNTIGNLVVDEINVYVDNRILPLTAFELKVLHCLTQAKGAVVSVPDLHAALYGHAGNATESNVLQVFVGRLRKKLTAAGALVTVNTHRNRGYAIEAAA